MSGNKYDTKPEGAEFTPREVKFLNLWSQGHSYREIADEMGISMHTVKTFKTRTKNRALAAEKTVTLYERVLDFRADNTGQEAGEDE